MCSFRASLVLVLLHFFALTVNSVISDRNIPGAIELVGYSDRRARMNVEPFHDPSKYVTSSLEKERADIETVKQNIEAYNKLMKIDTKKLTNQQKDMLERIVERVARLKAVLDTDAKNSTKDQMMFDLPTKATTIQTIELTTTPMTPSPSAPPPSKDDPTKATTVSATTVTEQQVTSTKVEETTKHDQTEARANNKMTSSISTNSRLDAGTQKVVRQTTTPKTLSVSATARAAPTKRTVASRNPQQKHSTTTNILATSASPVHGYSAATPSSLSYQSKQNTKHYSGGQDTLQEISSGPHKQLQKQQQSHDEIADESSIVDSNGEPITSDLIYDSNETASSIIDSLANHAREDYYTKGHLGANAAEKKKPSATAKPTKYHYYPHNQHIYLLPECAIQQVCNAVYVRLNYTQPLCACPSRYRDPCSASLNEDDQHTTKLVGNSKKKAITLAKTCEATTEMRECRSPKDWSLLALQNTRTGKSHYLVICRCPDHFKLEGPMAHDQPTYASVPGIRVFGMMCVRPGYSVRKPSIQPPKRYQLQKPFYTPSSSSNAYISNKDTRPSAYQDDNSYQMQQHQANYQYLNRPESAPILGAQAQQDFSEISLNQFGGIYGRNNERNSENTVSAAAVETTESSSSSNSKREKRSTVVLDSNDGGGGDDENENDEIPPFPWDTLREFQKSIVWN